jgi:redox-regulated HSP33 family molecular chaperone
MKGNDYMEIKFSDKKFNFELLDGEYRRYVENDVQTAEYLCVGVCGKNKILFQYINTAGESIDFVERIVDNIPEFALDYLTDVLTKNDDMLVRLTFIPVLPTSFEIYYNCDCESNVISDIIQWMSENNDFAATEFRYTEIINGHQKCVGE